MEQAEKQGYFTLDEWRKAHKALRAGTVIKLKKSPVDLEKEVRSHQPLQTSTHTPSDIALLENQKSIDIESICVLLDLVLGSQFRPQVDALMHYPKISSPDRSNYDPDQAWPWIVDNLVDWVGSNQG